MTLENLRTMIKGGSKVQRVSWGVPHVYVTFDPDQGYLIHNKTRRGEAEPANLSDEDLTATDWELAR